MRLEKFGHCCLLIEEAGSRLLMDPGSFSSGFEGLTGLTGVLVTHIHGDHLDLDRLLALLQSNPEARIVCDEASAALAERDVRGHVVQGGDQLDLGVSVRVYGREHAVIHPDLPAVPNVGYLVADRFFYAGDAFTLPEARVDVLAVPIGVPDGSARIGRGNDDPEEVHPPLCGRVLRAGRPCVLNSLEPTRGVHRTVAAVGVAVW